MNNSTKKTFKIHFIPILIIGFLTAIDQFTKFVIVSSFELYQSKPVIKDIFSFTYIQNTGTAWGVLKGRRVMFIILAILILIMCFYVFNNIAKKKRFLPMYIATMLLAAGGIGNMIDRIKLGYVIDFLSFDLINFPVFNVADMYVVCGMVLVVVLVLFIYSDEELDLILGLDSNNKKKNSKKYKNNVESVAKEDSDADSICDIDTKNNKN